MELSEYYEELKQLARDTRQRYGLNSESVSLSSLREIYRAEEIHIDYWHHKLRKIRGAYLLVGSEPHVLVNGAIKPKEPRIFILAHELKHHLMDRELAKDAPIGCQEISWTRESAIEIGAEIFAAELIYPEAEFLSLIDAMGLQETGCEPQAVVRLKRSCPAPVSYTFLVKRLVWFGVVDRDSFRGIQFQKLEESMFGVPFYGRHRRL